MKIIIAQLNGTNEFSHSDIYLLKDCCESLGIANPSLVDSFEKLTKSLEESAGENLVLFTNFPPNSSYPGSGKTLKEVEMGDYINRSWEADSYSKSNIYFHEVLPKYNFKVIHFITGAPENMVGDKTLKELLPGAPIKLIRRNAWIGKETRYSELYLDYLIKGIEEAAK